ncbi:hypothetical protein BDD12DRAFT_846810 [Trichophaea hybrida]|nr:hypothetical protein BDD12DRAFT_846810 [Trichophaea hybrida]
MTIVICHDLNLVDKRRCRCVFSTVHLLPHQIMSHAQAQGFLQSHLFDGPSTVVNRTAELEEAKHSSL